MAALTLPAFAGETTGSEAQGEADGSFNASAQEPEEVGGQDAAAQGGFLLLPGVETTGAASASPTIRNSRQASSADEDFRSAGSGMDGGNRR